MRGSVAKHLGKMASEVKAADMSPRQLYRQLKTIWKGLNHKERKDYRKCQTI